MTSHMIIDVAGCKVYAGGGGHFPDFCTQVCQRGPETIPFLLQFFEKKKHNEPHIWFGCKLQVCKALAGGLTSTSSCIF